MQSDKNLNCLAGVLLATGLSAAAVGCMVTGLKLPVESLHQIVMVCFGCAAVASFCYRFRYGGWVLRLLAIAGIWWFFQDPERFGILLEQARVAANRITKLWNNAYGWHVISLRAQRICDWPLMIIGGFLAIAASRTVCRQKRSVFPILTAMGPFSLCLVVNDTVPDLPWLYLFLLTVAVLSLTDWIRRKNLRQSLELTAYSTAVAAIVLAGLFFLCPQETYVNRTDKLQGHLLNLAQELPVTMKEWGQTVITHDIQTVQPQRENLHNLGDRIEREYTVLEVTTEFDGILYLRGQDFDSYDGKTWTATRNRNESFSAGTDPLFWEEDSHTVTVTTRTVKDVRYVPYYPQAATAFVGGKLENQGNMRTYSYIRRQPVENWEELQQSISSTYHLQDSDFVYTVGTDLASSGTDLRYRNLPLETQEQAKQLVSSILTGEEGSTSEKAEKIEEYVQFSASYSLTPDKMPADSADFALWFLEEADRGYCIHFATAATVLLRAAGIDARYVTGYVARTVPGKTVSVPASQAHAWVEYFEPALGIWMVLEPTPPDFLLDAPEISESQETTEATRPPVTRPTLPEQTETPETTERDVLEDTVRHEDDKGLGLLKKIAGFFKNLLTGALVIGAVWGQYKLRLELLRKRCSHPDPNTRALHLWRDAEKLCRIQKQEPPETLEMLAQKARFSQYALTDRELAEFTAFGVERRKQLQAKPWYAQFVYRIVLALY
jgi:transglutaminase-like putative cysteine protease